VFYILSLSTVGAMPALAQSRLPESAPVTVTDPASDDGNTSSKVASSDSEKTTVRTLAPVVVTGAATRYTEAVSVGGKEPLKPREIPQSVSVITQQRIEDQAMVTVADALNQVTGITVVSNSTTQSQYRSRGWGLGVTYDGVPAYDSSSGYQQLDLAIYERLEVLRGPAGLFSGTGQPGGVMNLVRKRGQKEFAASASVSAGSWDNYGVQADVTGPFNASGSVRGRVVVSTVDRNYFYDRTDTKKLLGYGSLEWDITPSTTLSLAAAIQDDKTKASYSGLPAYSTGELMKVSRSTNPYPDWNRHNWTTKDFIAELTHRFDNGWNTTLKLNHRDQDYHFKDSYPRSPGVNPVTDTLGYSRRLRDFSYERDGVDLYFSGPFTLFGREHRAVLGYNIDTMNVVEKGAGPASVLNVPFGRPDLVPTFHLPYDYGGETEYRQSGYYGQLRLRLADPLTAIVGARVSDYRQRSRDHSPSPTTAWVTATNKTNDEVTPYAGLVFDVNKNISLYGSYSDIFQPQTQKKADGSTLDPHVGKQYEIGSKAEFFDGKLTASLSLFNLRDKNRAYADPDNPGFYLSSGEVESKGWEIEVAGSPAPGWDIQGGYTRLDTKYLKDVTYKGVSFDTWEPKHTFKLWGVRRFEGGPLAGLSVGLGINTVSGTQATKADTGTGALRSQGGFTIANALVSYRIDKNLTLAFNANNLFDKTYYTRFGGLATYNSYGEPRNYTLTLRVKY
jgi:outer membrane receptor for ferric coprogen and ferric-rhodotorulic acid